MFVVSRLLIAMYLALFLVGGCTETAPSLPGPDDARATGRDYVYILDAGDRVRITVFGESDLSGEFEIDSSRKVAMPLVGQIDAGGLTLNQFQDALLSKLREGYLKAPRVAVEVVRYRPFYILGEVNKPGSYTYVSGITVLNAIALAGGYSYRGSKERTLIVRGDDPNHAERPASESTYIYPGDTIKVRERFF